MKTAFYGGIYQYPTGLPPPPFFLFYSNQRRGGGGALALVPLSYMPVTVVHCSQDLSTRSQSEGAKRPRGGGGGGMVTMWERIFPLPR